MAGNKSTRRTVLVAGAANVVVAAAKLTAGLVTGSSAMLAETAHSMADTLNQAFLLTSLHQGDRPADERHPFGHGQERYFWSLLAAFGIFVAGAGFSVFEGVLELHRSGDHDFLIAYIVLAVSLAAEGTSLIRAYRQVHGEARAGDLRLVDHVRSCPDITVKAALFEDGAASIAIGALLIVVAVRLGLDSRELLIGKAAEPRDLELIRNEIQQTPGVDALLELLTMYLGPDHLIVAGRVALDDEVSADRVEDLADDIDRRLAEKLTVIPHVFIDPTQTSPGRDPAARQ
jgi:cation diffusion facilitator family transporter